MTTGTRTVVDLVTRAGLWPARALWLVGPLAAGPALRDLLASRADTPALVVEVVLWLAWFGVLVATLVPTPLSLTACRIATPAAVAGLGVVAVAEGTSSANIGALAWALVVSAVCYLPDFGDRMINGSAYGSERRMALRPPGYVLVGPAQMAFLAVLAGLVGPLALILSERWLLVAIAVPVGALAAWAGARVLHQLARRWVVFVPAGFVIRDPVHLVDAILFRRNQIVALGPALATGNNTSGSTSGADGAPARTDLTGGARGLALEVALREPTPITRRIKNEANSEETANLVFTPTLPGAMLSEARIRGLKIGTAAEQAE